MAKDSPRTTAGELQKMVESRGQKTLKTNCQTAPTSPHVVWEDFKKNYPGSSKKKKKSPAYPVIRHDWNFKWLLWSEETKINSFLAANTQDGFGEHRDKKYSMCTMKYTALFLMLWALQIHFQSLL